MVRKFSYSFVIVLGLHLFASGFIYAQFSGGSGTMQDPYLISSMDDLREVANHTNKYFLQVNDIDASETINWNEGKGFIPIGTSSKPFSGLYDGDSYSIADLFINRSEDNSAGLFGYLRDGEVRDLTIQNISVRGNGMAGGLAGQVINSLIHNVKIQGSISGGTYSGGVAGYNQGLVEFIESDINVNGKSYVGGIAGFNRGKIHRAKAKGTVKGSDFGIGGIAGNNYDGTISESISNTVITGDKGISMGGIAGSNGGSILRSYSEGEVIGRTYLGGVTGNNTTGIIKYSYSTASVSGFNLIGGIAGVNKNGGIIHEVYTTGIIDGSITTGALIGINEDSLSAAYWTEESHNAAVGKGNDRGTFMISSESTSDGSFENFSFNENWGISQESFPTLLWIIPYFTIKKTEFKPLISQGEYLEIQVVLKNAGGLAYSGKVVLVNEKNEIIDQSRDVRLESDQEEILYLSWQTSEEDHGDFTFFLKTDHTQKPIEIKVLNMPQHVNLENPFDLQENINISPSFSWQRSDLSEHYELQISENENFDPVLYQSEPIDTTYFEIGEKLRHLTYYYWRVRGVNADYSGPWSTPSVFITIIEKPEPVALFEPEPDKSNASNTPSFVWSSSPRAQNYTLELSFEDEFEEVFFDTTVTAGDTLFTHEEELPSETEIFWRVQASNLGGSSDWSEVNSFRTVRQAKQKVERNSLDYALEQNYPNPFNPVTYIRYSIPEPGRVKIDILNMLGQVVATPVDNYRSAGWHTFSFDASELSSGIYIYRIQAGNFSDSKKFSLVK